jgi:2-polyprenyl-3-methyl-5-hydroxy-6-metoxy-1,4-benzoquinol methylase
MAEEYYSHERPELVRQIPVATGHVVLDLGCGVGALSSSLKRSGRADETWGLELVPEVAELARKNKDLDRVLEGDVETLVSDLPRGYFSHIVAGDVLEHLVDPWSVLHRLRLCLRPGGRFICSLPNIRNLSFIAKLLFAGSFEYRDSGVMDRTHLRFFARKDVLKLFADAGFREISVGPARPKRRIGYRLAKALLGDLIVKSLLVTAINPLQGVARTDS